MTKLTAFCLVLSIAGCANAQPADDASAPAPSSPVIEVPAESLPPDANVPATALEDPISVDKAVDELLDRLDQRGDTLKDFRAALSLTESDALTGLETNRLGTIWVQRENPDESRIRVLFDKRVTDRGNKPETLEYVLDNGWLTDRDYQRRIEIRRQVVAPGEKMDLLKLGEGPFPLPLGQSKEDVHQQFEVTRVAPSTDDPANTVHLHLVPKAGSDFENDLSSMDIWIDQESDMPVRIETVDADERQVKTIDLEDIQLDTGLADKDFTPDPIDANNWQMRSEAYGQ